MKKELYMYNQFFTYSLYTLFFLLIMFFIYKVNKDNKKMKELNNKLDFLSSDQQKIHNENFIKFLSDSREWAFSYIEEVQAGINKFIKEVDHEIEYFDKYGNIIATPMNKPMEIISKSYKDLKKLVPENDKEQ